MEHPDIEMHMATAKRGTWQKLGDTAKALAKLTYNSLVCNFSTRTNGSFFVMVEGVSENKMILVAPDDSIDFDKLSNMSVTDGLYYLANYVDQSPIPGWQDFVTWFDSKMAAYGGFISDAIICGYPCGSVPSYSNQSHEQVWLFDWMGRCAEKAGCSIENLCDYMTGDKFEIPIVVIANGFNVGITVQIAI